MSLSNVRRVKECDSDSHGSNSYCHVVWPFGRSGVTSQKTPFFANAADRTSNFAALNTWLSFRLHNTSTLSATCRHAQVHAHTRYPAQWYAVTWGQSKLQMRRKRLHPNKTLSPDSRCSPSLTYTKPESSLLSVMSWQFLRNQFPGLPSNLRYSNHKVSFHKINPLKTKRNLNFKIQSVPRSKYSHI